MRNQSVKITKKRCYVCGHDKFSTAGTNTKGHCMRCKRGPTKLTTIKNKHGKMVHKIVEE